MNKLLSSLAFKYLERFSSQVVTFIVSLVLARLLSPAEYGTLSLLLVFINLANAFVQSGLNTALIQKLKADDKDFSTVFWGTLGTAVVFYFIIFFSAPLIASFYDMPSVTLYLRVIAVSLFPGAVNSIQIAKLSRDLAFKRQFTSSLIGATVSGLVGIGMAYAGFGVWSLIFQQIFNPIVISIVLFITVAWRPKFYFSVEKFKNLYSFGWKLMCSSLLETLYLDLTNLVIGRKYDASTLGVYTRGKQFPQLIVSNINGTINSVMLPALSKRQEDPSAAKSLMRRAIKSSSFLIWPMMIGMAVVSKPTVSLILTDKWLGCVPYIQIICLSYGFMPIHTANLQAINAMGRSDIYLKLEIVKKIYGITILLIAVFCFDSPIAIAISSVVSGLLSTFVNANPNKRLLSYSYFEQLRDIAPCLVLSIIMGVCIYPFSFIITSDILLLVVQIVSGATIYVLLAAIFRVEAFTFLWNLVIGMLKGKMCKSSDSTK